MIKFFLIIFLMVVLVQPSQAFVDWFNVKHFFISKKEEKKNPVKDEKKEEKKVEEKINESEFSTVHIGKLLNEPNIFIDKQVRFIGEFSSFSTLALDYMPAYRSSKDYISFAIFRPSTTIPLSELKLAYPVEKAKDNTTLIELEKGDTIEIFGKVFSAALDEPWVDVVSIKKIKSANKENDDNEKSSKEDKDEEKSDEPSKEDKDEEKLNDKPSDKKKELDEE